MRPWSAPPSPFAPPSPTRLPMSAPPPGPASVTNSETETTTQQSPRSDRRTRPLTDQIQIIRELWLLRELARVQAAERCFLAELERLLAGRAATPFAQDDGPPTPPQSAAHSRRMEESPPQRPPPPPPPPRIGVQTNTTFSPNGFMEDGHVFESHPPPRRDSAPARERIGATELEVEQLRSRQRVTNLSPEFRALLEGNGPSPDYRNLVRSRSFGQLSDQRAVSSALDSEFRHHLEQLLVRRDQRGLTPPLRHMYRTSPTSDANSQFPSDQPEQFAHHPQNPHQFPQQHHSAASSHSLEAVVRALREEVNVLKNVISASFDLQLDIQRSIRQEVSAAINSQGRMNMSRPDAVQETSSACTTDPAEMDAEGATTSTGQRDATVMPRERTARPVAAGICTVCLEARIDSLLYGCGHMCTCSMCGRQLIASGQSCPICRAPVRDVVRAFMVTE